MTSSIDTKDLALAKELYDYRETSIVSRGFEIQMKRMDRQREKLEAQHAENNERVDEMRGRFEEIDAKRTRWMEAGELTDDKIEELSKDLRGFKEEQEEVTRTTKRLESAYTRLAEDIQKMKAAVARSKQGSTMDEEEGVQYYLGKIKKIRGQHEGEKAQERALVAWCAKLLDPLYASDSED